MDDAEQLYRSGAARWAERDLAGAVAILDQALAASEAHPDRPWQFAITRALAQVSMERDNLPAAEYHLRRMPGDGTGIAQQMALRARLALLQGDPEDAAAKLSVGFARLVAEPATDDIGTLMNSAIALAWMGDVLVELGLGRSAARVETIASQLVDQAGVADPVVRSMLAAIRAGAARLAHELDAAERALAEVERALDPGLDVVWHVEHARLTWEHGDGRRSESLYATSIELARRHELASTARLLELERAQPSPPGAVEEAGPLELWALQGSDALAAAQVPYALVLTLPVEGDLERYAALEDAVDEVLSRAPGLGGVDGIGTDGQVWELFLDGDDPVALWSAVRTIVESFHPPPGSRVAVRKGTEAVTIPLA